MSSLNDDEKHKLLDEKSEKEGYTPLHFAAKFGHLNVVELLLSHGASTTIKSKLLNLPIHVALNANIGEIISKDMFILLYTSNPDTLSCKGSHGNTVAHFAAEHSLVAVLEEIKKYDSPLLVIKNQDSRTPLMIAISKNQEKSTSYLLENTQITIMDEWGNNAQCYADNFSTPTIKTMVQNHFDNLPFDKLTASVK